jgi:hypothetical protein
MVRFADHLKDTVQVRAHDAAAAAATLDSARRPAGGPRTRESDRHGYGHAGVAAAAQAPSQSVMAY